MSHKILYLGCDRSTCVYNDEKKSKCTRTVIMMDDKGRCKSYIDPTESWLERLFKGRRVLKRGKQEQAS